MFLVALRMSMCLHPRFSQNVVDFFASTYKELVDTSFSYLLLA